MLLKTPPNSVTTLPAAVLLKTPPNSVTTLPAVWAPCYSKLHRTVSLHFPPPCYSKLHRTVSLHFPPSGRRVTQNSTEQCHYTSRGRVTQNSTEQCHYTSRRLGAVLLKTPPNSVTTLPAAVLLKTPPNSVTTLPAIVLLKTPPNSVTTPPAVWAPCYSKLHRTVSLHFPPSGRRVTQNSTEQCHYTSRRRVTQNSTEQCHYTSRRLGAVLLKTPPNSVTTLPAVWAPCYSKLHRTVSLHFPPSGRRVTQNSTEQCHYTSRRLGAVLLKTPPNSVITLPAVWAPCYTKLH